MNNSDVFEESLKSMKPGRRMSSVSLISILTFLAILLSLIVGWGLYGQI